MNINTPKKKSESKTNRRWKRLAAVNITKSLEGVFESGGGDRRVQIENHDGALVMAVRDGFQGRNHELGPHGLTSDEPTTWSNRKKLARQIIGRQRRRSVEDERIGGVVVAKPGLLLLHVLLPKLPQGPLCMPQIVEMDGHDPFAHSLHLHPPHLPEPLHLPAHRPLAHVTRHRAQQHSPRRGRRWRWNRRANGWRGTSIRRGRSVLRVRYDFADWRVRIENLVRRRW